MCGLKDCNGNLLFVILFQQLGNFKAEINKSKVAGKHWRRERGNLRFEDVPGAAPEDLELVDVVSNYLCGFLDKEFHELV